MAEQPRPEAQPPSEEFQLVQSTECKLPATQTLKKLKDQYSQEPSDPIGKSKLNEKWESFLQEVQVVLGTLLRVDNVSVLLGSGASRYAGGPLIGRVPIDLENRLLSDGVQGDQVQPWLYPFYFAVKRFSSQSPFNGTPESIKRRKSALDVKIPQAETLEANYEEILSCLYRWQGSLGTTDEPLKWGAAHPNGFTNKNLADCIEKVKAVLISACMLSLPRRSQNAHRQLVRRLLTRPLNLKRMNIFTLNYDTLIEQAADAEGVTLIDGFSGTIDPVFRPEVYDHDLYFPGDTTEGKVHRLEKVMHLYKLHGSINWQSSDSGMSNPYGVSRVCSKDGDLQTELVLVYPTASKFGDTLGMPYSEMFRRFASAIVRPQSVLIVIGYGFGDDHVNAIIQQALSVPSFTLLIIDPTSIGVFPNDKLPGILRDEIDERVLFITGDPAGTFEWFVQHMLPNLREEEIRKKVAKTFRAIAKKEYAGEDEDV